MNDLGDKTKPQPRQITTPITPQKEHINPINAVKNQQIDHPPQVNEIPSSPPSVDTKQPANKCVSVGYTAPKQVG